MHILRLNGIEWKMWIYRGKKETLNAGSICLGSDFQCRNKKNFIFTTLQNNKLVVIELSVNYLYNSVR